jgi:hypothetical protein
LLCTASVGIVADRLQPSNIIMRAELHGDLNGTAAVAVVGTWDPLLPRHEELFKLLGEYSRNISLASLVIMLHPPPPSFIPESPAEWPVYDDPETRISLIQACGISATLLIHFQKEDLDAPLTDFFEIVRAHAKLDELWLGAEQTLGRGPEASNQILAELSEERSILLQRLPSIPNPYFINDARDLLRQGQLAKLVGLIGRPAVWRRPARGKLKLLWPPGYYLCFATEGPDHAPQGPPITLQLVAESNGISSAQWPGKDIKWLAFTAGPADLR